ncbi:septum site-determining protein MinD [Thermaerobacter sp. PB12/4term]|uniref:septum site-determining protein MinD n=1 Tax=Thermaerobacter sp. PB12/4term TaxID=2293838 RepID=UPI000E324FE6|nr:septum site-determining protein MinD [Thermaerobacter sp. PB12/4term]QIA27973.1 septum site-determining protein MinD [Thermaerobacter sp. PB12/4term]
MGTTLVVTSGKGGVGKTTTTANLGTALALTGKRVVLVDADIGLRNLDVVMGLENRIVYDLVDVVEGFCRLRQALIKDKRYDGLFLLPAAQTKDKTAVRPEQFKALCEELAAEFDYVLVDSPAGIEQGFRNAIAGAQEALVVCTPDVSSVRDADRVIGLLEAEGLAAPRLIINKLRPDMVQQGRQMGVEDVLDVLAIELIGVVPEDEQVVDSTNRGEPVVAHERSRAGRAYRDIVRRLLGEQVPFPDFKEEHGLLGRLRRLLGGA